jgi:hypothetical protein
MTPPTRADPSLPSSARRVSTSTTRNAADEGTVGACEMTGRGAQRIAPAPARRLRPSQWIRGGASTV